MAMRFFPVLRCGRLLTPALAGIATAAHLGLRNPGKRPKATSPWAKKLVIWS
jgi:hypothetical protein